MNYRSMFPKQYIAAEDLNGNEVTLTISGIKQEKVKTDKGSDDKWCLYFVEMEKRAQDKKGINKRLILNITNARTIAKLHGAETDEWKGKQIVLYPTTCDAFGSQTDCIRIKGAA